MDTSQPQSLGRTTGADLTDQLLDLLPLGVLVNDSEGLLVFVNRAFVELTGYKPELLLGMSYGDQVETLVPPEERYKVRARQAFEHGELTEPYEAHATTAYGYTIPVAIRQYPLLSEGSTSAGSITLVQDLSRQYERRRFSLTAEFVLDTMDAMVVAVDTTGDFILVNRAAERMLGVPRHELIGTHHKQLFPDAPQTYAYLTRSLENGEVFENANAVLPYQRRSLDLLVNCRQIRDEKGRVMGACLVAADVSELKHLQRVSALGQMAAVLSHELRNPLTVAKGNLQLLAMEQDDPLISAALTELGRIESIIADVRVTSQGAQPRRTSASATESVKHLLARARTTPPAPNVGLVADYLPDEEVTVAGISGHQLEQVLWNLFQNAAEAMQPGGGTVTVSLAVNEELAVLSVADDGPGIPSELLERVFDPFFTTKEAGTGLGLTVCRTLVERAGGRIQIASSPETGTRFELSFPLFHA